MQTMLQNDYNTTTSASYRLVIPDHEHLNYHIQRTSLPGMRQTAVQGGITNHPFRVPGETIEYDQLTVDFLVAEDYENVLQLHQWLIEAKSKEKEYNKRLKDITLHIVNRNGVGVCEFTFYGAFPVDVGAISLDSTLNDVETPICTTTFEYQYYRRTK